jgi:poly-gamma-glutamate synthesis protein (capsule biosynthesis protein)
MKRIASLILSIILLMSIGVQSLAETKIITLTCGGDTLLGSNEKVRYEDFSFQSYVNRYGLDYPFANFKEMFENDDITLLNLEVVLTDEPDEKADKSRFNFRGPTEYAKILSQNSVEVVNLANNHTMDYGQKGFDATVGALDKVGVGYCGSDAEDVYTWVFEKDGIKIGFMGVVPLFWVDNKVHQQKLRDAGTRLKEEGCAAIVASLHCGREYLPKHDDIHDKYRRICMSLGADIVIGTHPHVPQGVHVTEEGVLHFYSLGNFAFGGNTGVDERISCVQALVAQVQMHFEDSVYIGCTPIIWPIHQSGTLPENNYQPVFVSGEEAETVMKMVQRDTRFKLKPFVEGEGAVQDFIPRLPNKK